jgi:hypothetical protein
LLRHRHERGTLCVEELDQPAKIGERSPPAAIPPPILSTFALRAVSSGKLIQHPRRDLAWRYGIGLEILDPVRRTAEIGNWLREVAKISSS